MPPSPRSASSPAQVVDRLKATALDMVALVAGSSDEQLVREPAPGEWSVATVIAHLADAELVWGVRLRRLLCEDAPRLESFDQDEWAQRFAPLEPTVRESLHRWRVLREASLRVFESLHADEWRRCGVLAERGPLTVAALADVLAAHDREHLDQIRRALAE